MTTIDVRSQGNPLLPSSEPRRSLDNPSGSPIPVLGERGTAAWTSAEESLLSLWVTRQQQWHMAFQQKIAPRLAKYWAIWRAFNQGPNPGPGQEWRDRTVIPQAYKELDTIVPKMVMGLWSDPRSYTIRGRGYRDADYEEMVRTLMDTALDEIGVGDPQGELFLKRMIDAEYYKQIMGHVWYKTFWRKETAWFKTKLPRVSETGEITGWDPIERLETITDGVDIYWLPLTRLAIDVYGKRRWAIERVITFLESLKEENERFQSQYKRKLYPEAALDLLELSALSGGTSAETEEPRDTEHWPLDDNGLYSQDPGHHRVELLLCWDNVKRTLTKIANRTIVLDHGLADTPDGLDPYIGSAAIPVPGSPYGDSIFNWTGSLYTRQTRLARARMDETMMNLFQQYLVREGALKGTTWFWRPGGISPVASANQDRPISDSIYLVPRRPLPPEAYQEESYAQQQSEAVTGADSISQGVEATTKSRDVTAAETNQRVMQGATRIQMRLLYTKAATLKPMMQKVFNLLRANLTEAKKVRILDDFEGQQVDLTKLARPIDIMISDPTEAITEAETMAELDRLVNLDKQPNFSATLKHREISEEIVKTMVTLRRNSSKFVRTEKEMEEQAQKAQAQAAMQQGMAPGGGQPVPTDPGMAPPPGESSNAPLAGGNGSSGPINPAEAARETIEV